jgi:uncharacterized protein with PIN domain
MTRILLDAMCGGLRSYLRMCGHDTVYSLDRGVEADDELLRITRAEDRLLITRDEELAARAERSVLLRSLDVEDQLRELLDAGVDLTLDDEPTHCGRCNGRLERAGDEPDLPEYVPDPLPARIWRCRDCGQHFWKGSHRDDVAETLASLKDP